MRSPFFLSLCVLIFFQLCFGFSSCRRSSDDDVRPSNSNGGCAYPRENFFDTTNAVFNVFQANLNGEPWLPEDNTWGGIGDPVAKILVSESEQSISFSTRRDVIQHKEYCKSAIPDIIETFIFRIDISSRLVGQHQPISSAIYRKRDDGYTFKLDTLADNSVIIESAYNVDGNIRINGTFDLTFVAEENSSIKSTFSNGVFRMTENSL